MLYISARNLKYHPWGSASRWYRNWSNYRVAAYALKVKSIAAALLPVPFLSARITCPPIVSAALAP
jgi:hypothetical protein